ncbi:AP-4 complex accessory subunit tepsin isoform X3 [Strix aluco]|uniref:AP-4 complex accessory subunit tepsin isoform X3 n=1 Tax=Strix aluco TaxID=111821 RepID=UPI003DA496BE
MAAPLRDRLSFLSRLPVLLRGTADDDVPCPGYLFEEIAKISHESPGSSQCLLEYLLNRLQSNSCHVKLKVLKILLHTCTQGSPQFVLQLKRNACFIREAAVFAGPPDPLHGNSLNQKVRAAAQDLASVIFSDAPLPQPAVLPARPLPPAGMGSSPSPCGSLQGFGFSSEKSGSTSTGEALLSTIQRAAEAVAHAVLPSPEGPRPCRGELREDAYEPVRAPSPARSPAGAVKPPAATSAHSTRGSHQPGLAGGGWEEADSGHSSQDSSQGNGELSRTSDSCSKSGSDSHSGASRELAHVAERVDADSLGDCVREVSLVSVLTRGARVFLTREEAQHFVKECGLLNCEVVLELLSRALEDPSDSVRMVSAREVHVRHLLPHVLRPALPGPDLCRHTAAPAAAQPRQPRPCRQPSNQDPAAVRGSLQRPALPQEHPLGLRPLCPHRGLSPVRRGPADRHPSPGRREHPHPPEHGPTPRSRAGPHRGTGAGSGAPRAARGRGAILSLRAGGGEQAGRGRGGCPCALPQPLPLRWYGAGGSSRRRALPRLSPS